MQVQPGLTSAQIGVLKYLKQRGPSGAKEIASASGVTPASIRSHLTALEKAGLVNITLQRRGAGRPAHVYSLAEVARTVFPNDYEGFVVNFIRATVELLGEDKLQTIFKRVQMNAQARHSPRMADKDLEDRVAEMARILTDTGYMAGWRRIGNDTFELTEHNCSVLQVAGQYPEVCACELALIRQLLGASVDRQEHILGGDSVCRYLIQRPTLLPQKSPRQQSVLP